MTKKIEKLLKELDSIEDKLIEEINNIDNKNELNNRLIELLTQFPEHKNLIKFIIHINDNLTNSQIKSTDALIDAITELIAQKKRLLELIEELHKPKPIKNSNIFVSLKEIPQIGWIVLGVSLISFLLFVFLLIHPEKTDTIAKTTTTLMQKNYKKR